MHIPEGFLGPIMWLFFWAAMLPVWIVAARKVKKNLKTKDVPLISIGAAFSFVIMMFNVPIPGGSTGHAVGATLIAIVLGPWAAVIAISVTLIIQALLFGDGGVTAIAANCFNIAFVMPFVGYYVYRLISAGSEISSMRQWVGAGVGGYLSINAAAILVGIELGVQPLLYRTPEGQALYFPYSLNITLPAMAFGHIFFFGAVEFIVTALVIKYFQRSDPEMFEIARGLRHEIKKLWIGLGILILLTPLGIIAKGAAWGEWGPEEFKELIGYVPQGMEKGAALRDALLTDYTTPELGKSSIGYVLSAIIGVAAIILLVNIFGRFLK